MENNILNKYDLYKGAEVIVDYNLQDNKDIINYFEDASNFEGYATLISIDFDLKIFYIEDMEQYPISIDCLIALNNNTNENEYIAL